MAFLEYLKASAFSDWLSVSLLGFPALIALHSVGMGVAVGLALMVTLRLYGVIAGFDERQIPRLLQLAVWGFLLNLATGLAIFITRGPEYVVTAIFLLKLVLVFSGAAILWWLKNHFATARPASAAPVIDTSGRRLSLTLTLLWFGAVIAGRLIAYLSDLYT